MRLLHAVFLGMFAYGMWAGIYGPGLLAGMMLLFNVWAERKMAADDRAYYAHPRSAKLLGPSTNDALADYECECMRSKF